MLPPIRRICVRAALLLALAAAGLMPGRAVADSVTVFAAASLKTALDEVAARWADGTGHTAVLSFAGSSALARQIEAGAPADVFISASSDWMDALDAAGRLRPGTRRDILRNTLVLIAHGSDVAPVEISPGLDLGAVIGDGRLAMALVDAVPAGIYGKAALTSLGLWDGVAARVAQTDNVRAALALVASGEAPYGIVYASDAVAEPDVSVVGTFAEATHPPIVYPVAIMADSDSPVAGEFLTFLSSETARAAFRAQGFGIVE